MKYVLLIISFLVCYQNTVAKDNDTNNKRTCSLEAFSAVSPNISPNLKKKSFDSTKYSTEGAHIDAYFNNHSLIKIITLIYGESSKTQIEYVFNSPLNYVVTHTRYYYSSPIYTKNSQIMATSSTKFLVCNGKPQKVVDQSDIQKYFDVAEQLLKDTLEQLNENVKVK